MTRKLFLFQFLVLAGALAATAILYPHLPGTVATHWDWRGQPNGYSSREMLYLVGPGLLAAFMVLTAVLPWLSPKRFDVDGFRSTYTRIMVYVYILIAYLDAITLGLASGRAIDAGRAIMGGVCLFLVLIGNLMGKVRRNFYIGVRTPWTLASEKVWNSTHRLAAKTLFASGLLGLASAIAGLQTLPIFFVLAGALIPVIYSLVYYKQLERRGELENGAQNPLGSAQ